MTARSAEDTVATDSGVELLSRDIGFLLARISQSVIRATNAALEEHGLRMAQYTILVACSGENGLAQRDIAPLLKVAPSQVANLVGELERNGLISRELDPHDARALRIMTTAEGRRIADAAAPSAKDAGEQFLSGLNESERHAFLGLLRRIGA